MVMMMYRALLLFIEDIKRSWRSRHEWKGGDVYISTNSLRHAELRFEGERRRRES